MEIEVRKENLSSWDLGGAYREGKTVITVDSSLTPLLQRQALIHELLSLHLDPLECQQELITELAHILAESLEQLNS